MPAQKSTSGLSKFLGAKAVSAHSASKDAPINWGFTNLPAGISGGVAQIVQCYWATYEKEDELKGKPYLSFRAVVKTPKEFKGQLIEGAQFSIQIPLCDTPNRKRRDGNPGTFDGYYGDAMDEFKKLLGQEAVSSVEDMDTLIALVDQEKPHSKFSTRGYTPKPSPQKPNPTEMVFQQLDGVTDAPADVSSNGTVDNTVHEPPPAPPAKAPPKAPTVSKPSVAPRPGAKPAPKAPEPEPEPEFNEFLDLVSVASSEDDTKERDDAQETLRNAALAAGYTADEITAADGWQDVADMGNNPKEAAPDAPTWNEQDVCKYTPLDDKGKPKLDKNKKPMRAMQCTILKVYEDAADIRDLATKTTFKSVPFAHMSEP